MVGRSIDRSPIGRVPGTATASEPRPHDRLCLEAPCRLANPSLSAPKFPDPPASLRLRLRAHARAQDPDRPTVLCCGHRSVVSLMKSTVAAPYGLRGGDAMHSGDCEQRRRGHQTAARRMHGVGRCLLLASQRYMHCLPVPVVTARSWRRPRRTRRRRYWTRRSVPEHTTTDIDLIPWE